MRIVPGEDVAQAQGRPHLTEARVDVEKHTPFGGIEQPVVRQATHDVQQKCAACDFVAASCGIEPDPLCTAVDDEREAIAQIEAAQHFDQVAYVHRIADGAWVAVLVDTLTGHDFVQQQHVPAKLAEPEHVLQQGPGVAAVPRFLS